MRSRADVRQLMVDVFAQCMETREKAHTEYAHDENNALGNFERTGAEMQIPREKVWYIFAKKHWDGTAAWIRGHRSQRENVRGRIKDLIVYLVLLWAMVDDTEEGEANPSAAPVPSFRRGINARSKREDVAMSTLEYLIPRLDSTVGLPITIQDVINDAKAVLMGDLRAAGVDREDTLHRMSVILEIYATDGRVAVGS